MAFDAPNGYARPTNYKKLQNKKRCAVIFTISVFIIFTFFIILRAAWLLHLAIQNKFYYSRSNAYHTITMATEDDVTMNEDKLSNKRKITTI